MNKKHLCVAIATSFILNVPVLSMASELNMFLDKCGTCHKDGAEAAPVNPADKAGVVWAKYFKRGRHPGDLSSSVSADEMKVVIQFLANHAADSDHPVAAIIPK